MLVLSSVAMCPVLCVVCCGAGAAPPCVAHEDAVVGGSADDILR